jgi:hypothetical protein
MTTTACGYQAGFSMLSEITAKKRIGSSEKLAFGSRHKTANECFKIKLDKYFISIGKEPTHLSSIENNQFQTELEINLKKFVNIFQGVALSK